MKQEITLPDKAQQDIAKAGVWIDSAIYKIHEDCKEQAIWILRDVQKLLYQTWNRKYEKSEWEK